jgi:hypothetical protein
MQADEIINKYVLDKRTWTHKGFHGVLHFFFAVGDLVEVDATKGIVRKLK